MAILNILKKVIHISHPKNRNVSCKYCNRKAVMQYTTQREIIPYCESHQRRAVYSMIYSK